MTFEFSHLLQPLSPPDDGGLASPDPAEDLDLRVFDPPADEAPSGPFASEEPVGDPEPSDDWLLALLSDPAPATEAEPPAVPADPGPPPEAPAAPRPRSSTPDDTAGATMPSLPGAAVDVPRSRFATPSLDDDLLPIRPKRR